MHEQFLKVKSELLKSKSLKTEKPNLRAIFFDRKYNTLTIFLLISPILS